MKIITTIYHDPEYYPPTLNAVNELAKQVEEVIMVTRQFKTPEWNYPKNTTRIDIGPLLAMEDMYNQSTFTKVKTFVTYLIKLRQSIIRHRPAFVLCYDNIAAFAFWLLRFTLIKQPKFWYHNHDVLDISACRKYSVKWWSGIFEPRFFPKIDLFSLPSTERKSFFNIKDLKGKFLYLPNYPATGFYRDFQNPDFKVTDEIKIIYQGTINAGHGLENIIPVLDQKVNGKNLKLNIVGFIKPKFKQFLLDLAGSHNVLERFEIMDPVAYSQLPAITARHHIGNAVLVPQNPNYSTAATASNKIYEYIALGLPVLLFDNQYHRELLGQYKWAFFTDLGRESLVGVLQQIDNNYCELREAAISDFNENLNFEASFKQAISYIINGRTEPLAKEKE